MADRVRIGANARVYYNTGTFASPTWVEIETIRDLTRTSEWETTDATCRKHRRKKVNAKTLVSHSFEGELTCMVDDAAYLALEAAFDADDAMELLVLNGAKETNGVRGIRGAFHVTKLDEAQPLNGHITTPIQFQPADSANPLARVHVVSGSVTAVTAP